MSDEYAFYEDEPVIIGTTPGKIVGSKFERDKADKFCVEFNDDYSWLPQRRWFFASQITKPLKH